jgi:hypothetical protein
MKLCRAVVLMRYVRHTLSAHAMQIFWATSHLVQFWRPSQHGSSMYNTNCKASWLVQNNTQEQAVSCVL